MDDYSTVTRKERVLIDYLNDQDYEVIKNIMVIMYLGRDREYNKSHSPEAIFKHQRKDFESHWDEKKIIIDQITSKVPLDIYLSNGLKILQIK